MCLIQASNDTEDLEDRVEILEFEVENLKDQIGILENEDSILDIRISGVEDDVTSNQNSIAGKVQHNVLHDIRLHDAYSPQHFAEGHGHKFKTKQESPPA